MKQDDLYKIEVRRGNGWHEMDYVWSLDENYDPPCHGVTMYRPSSLDGYTPHNKKLLTYPYSYIEIGDFAGRKQDYRWEFFQLRSSGTYNWADFDVKIPGISDGTGYITPRNYNGVTGQSTLGSGINSEPFTFSYGNKVSWIYSVYQNWAAQN